jgi:hypothetical protein
MGFNSAFKWLIVFILQFRIRSYFVSFFLPFSESFAKLREAYISLVFMFLDPSVSLSTSNNSAAPGRINPLNAELNPICHLLALLGAHHFLHVSRIRVK